MGKSSISFKPLPVCALVVLLLFGCEGAASYEDFGLSTVVAMEIEPDHISIMRNGTYAKTAVPGTVWINDEEFDATISYSGATSIDNYKKSFEVKLGRPYEGRTVYRLNSMSNDPSAMRALTAYYVYELAGFEMPRLEPIAAWLNGSYAGLFLLQEKYDVEYFANRSQHPMALYQAENSVASMDDTSDLNDAFSTKIGTKELGDLKNLIQIVCGKPGDENRKQLERILDVENVLNYMAVVGFVAADDGVVNNYYFLRTNENKRFTVLPWDLDGTFYRSNGIDDGGVFERNHMMSRFYYEDEPYRRAYLEYFTQIAETADAKVMGVFVESLKKYISEAYAADRFLASGDISLDEHVAALKARFEETERLFKEAKKLEEASALADESRTVFENGS